MVRALCPDRADTAAQQFTREQFCGDSLARKSGGGDISRSRSALESLGRLTLAGADDTAAAAAAAFQRPAVGTQRDVDGPEMATTLLAIRLSSGLTRGPVRLQNLSGIRTEIVGTGSEIAAHDVALEGARARARDLEQSQHVSGQTHLRAGVVNDSAQPRMETQLWIARAHGRVLTVRRIGPGSGICAGSSPDSPGLERGGKTGRRPITHELCCTAHKKSSARLPHAPSPVPQLGAYSPPVCSSQLAT